MLSVLIIDYITYFTNLDYIFCFIISISVLGVMNFLLKKRINIKREFEKADIIFFIVLAAIAIISLPFPDRSFDTVNYHLYLQEHPFGDKINVDFFAGKNLNSFSYAFADRIFYMFRYFLGYRLGVIFNYLIIAVMYYQIKNMVKKLIPTIKSMPLVLFSTLAVTTLSVIDLVDSYYVDLISLVLLLEIARLVIFEKLDISKNNTGLFAYFGLLFGLCFCVKISNAILLILFFIIYIVKNPKIYKCLNYKNVLLTFLMLILPFAVYMIYTYIQTGNPVFPFYNTIFESQFFGNRNWLDTRFGPSRKIESLVWPIVIMFHPERCCDIGIVEPVWCLGYLISIIYLIKYVYYKFIKKIKIDDTRLAFFITTILAYICWAAFQLGYSRYGLIVLILGAIATSVFIYDIIKQKKNIIIGFAVIALFYNYSYVSNNYMHKGSFWIYNNYFNNSDDYKYNIINLFENGQLNVEFDENSVWAIFYCNAGLAQLVNNEIPIINVVNGADNEYTSEIMNSKLSNASKIYTLVDSLDFQNFINAINNTNYKIIDVKTVLTQPILANQTDYLFVFEIVKTNITNNNNFENFNSTKTFDVSGKNNISFFLGHAKDSNGNDNSFNATIIGIKDNHETIIDSFEISNKDNMKKLSYNVEEYDYLKIVSLDMQKNLIDGNWFMYLNKE